MENALHIEVIPAIKSEAAILKVAAYCRVSSSSEEQLNSYRAQVDYYTKLITSNEAWRLADIYADEGISGTSLRNREEFNRMIADAKRGKIDRIIVKSVSRFARNTKDCLEIVRELSAINVSVYFEEQELDTISVSGETMLSILSSIAQEESISISRNMRLSYRYRMSSGQYTPTTPPYGYRIESGRFVVDDAESKVISRIFSEYLSGKGIRKITQVLNDDNIKTKNNDIWNDTGVLYVLKNEKYIGDTLGGKWYTTEFPFRSKINNGESEMFYLENTHEAIISRDDFAKVQMMLKKLHEKHVKPSGNRKSPIGAVIKCSHCHCAMRRKPINGKIYYICLNRDRDKSLCPVPQIPEDEIINLTLKVINILKTKCRYILYPIKDQAARLMLAQKSGSNEIKLIEAKLLEISDEIHSYERLRMKNYIDSSVYIKSVSELKEEAERLKKEKHLLSEESIKDDIVKKTEKMIQTLECYDGTITDIDKNLLTNLIEKIEVTAEETLSFTFINGLKIEEKIERRPRR